MRALRGGGLLGNLHTGAGFADAGESWMHLMPDPKLMTADVRFLATKPIMRIFDEAKAKEFYLGFLGFTLDFEHRFGENFPLYAQVSRAGLVLHLSGHHGDASPGATVVVDMAEVEAYQRELLARDYMFNKPHIEDLPWGKVMTVTDPFSNRIRFTQLRG